MTGYAVVQLICLIVMGVSLLLVGGSFLIGLLADSFGAMVTGTVAAGFLMLSVLVGGATAIAHEAQMEAQCQTDGGAYADGVCIDDGVVLWQEGDR